MIIIEEVVVDEDGNTNITKRSLATNLIRCHGCGADFQHEQPDLPGYIVQSVFERKLIEDEERVKLKKEVKRLKEEAGGLLPFVVGGWLMVSGW
eukprot:Pgem_evm1s6398